MANDGLYTRVLRDKALVLVLIANKDCDFQLRALPDVLLKQLVENRTTNVAGPSDAVSRQSMPSK